MKVLVTGGTGFIGRAIVDALVNSGHLVRVLVRNPASTAATHLAIRSGIELRQGDLLSFTSLSGCASGMDAIIHLVGIIGEIGASTFENVHVQATRNLLHFALGETTVRHFVHMSALGTRPNAASRYHQTKWEAETAVRTSGLPYTVFRPSLVFGPGDRFVNLYARFVRKSPVVPLLGRKDTLFQPVAVRDVAAAFVAALNEPRAYGQSFDLCGPDRLTLRLMVEIIMRTLGRHRLLVRIPTPIARLQAGILECLYPRLFREPSPLSRDQLIMLQEDNVGNPQPAVDALQLKLTRFSTGIASFLR
jgi:NADH dehydrogenase